MAADQMTSSAAEHHETIRALAPGKEVTLEKLPSKQGSLTATATPSGVVFRWRFSEGGKQHRVVIGPFDRRAAHNSAQSTPAGYSVFAAYTEAWRLGAAHRSSLKASQQGYKAKRQQEKEDAEKKRQQAAAELEALRQREEAQRLAREALERTQSVTGRQAWEDYIEERRTVWGTRNYEDHVKLARVGGVPSSRGTRGRGVTVAGPLAGLLDGRLIDITDDAVNTWAAREGAQRATSARLALRCLKAFLNWCSKDKRYRDLVQGNAAKSGKAREALGKANVKRDALRREQLGVWFGAVRQLQNPTVAAYLQVLLLTGARPGEVLGIRWEDLNTRWRGLTIRDKVEGAREIPLTPYVASLVHGLPKRNEFVFASTRRTEGKYQGTVTTPGHYHDKACAVAGLEGLTLHGLRRSFKSLTEWLEIPAGVVAQIMGHKPSATAEKHYTVRPLDLLRIHHERIEAWILEQAGVEFQSTGGAAAANVVEFKRA